MQSLRRACATSDRPAGSSPSRKTRPRGGGTALDHPPYVNDDVQNRLADSSCCRRPAARRASSLPFMCQWSADCPRRPRADQCWFRRGIRDGVRRRLADSPGAEPLSFTCRSTRAGEDCAPCERYRRATQRRYRRAARRCVREQRRDRDTAFRLAVRVDVRALTPHRRGALDGALAASRDAGGG